ncbi:hypothetical protein KCP74_07570 [Salmonella enterica subsp. enterica]|nr:hypothetical protein KCP74_07570 [Salmonella enterica subsp. enterica]
MTPRHGGRPLAARWRNYRSAQPVAQPTKGRRRELHFDGISDWPPDGNNLVPNLGW